MLTGWAQQMISPYETLDIVFHTNLAHFYFFIIYNTLVWPCMPCQDIDITASPTESACVLFQVPFPFGNPNREAIRPKRAVGRYISQDGGRPPLLEAHPPWTSVIHRYSK